MFYRVFTRQRSNHWKKLHNSEKLLAFTVFNLNLPPYSFQSKIINGKSYILDIVRKKYVRLLPEEWVRQNFVHFLIQNGYPKSLMSLEKQFSVVGRSKKSDLLVYRPSGKVFMLVECKSPKYKLDNSTLQQALTYNTEKKTKYLALTNGLKHMYFWLDYENKELILLNQLPTYTRK